jgi:ATP-dependent DNA helicase DinG
VSKIDLEDIFSPQGLLAKKLTAFHPRPQQLSMAKAIHQAIENQEHLVAEAATGTGKTFAYLIPALLSGKKILISTATKTLQDQLVHHDIPKILSILGIARTVVNLKGRDNYLCRYHLEEVAQQNHQHASEYIIEMIKIYEQLPSLSIGEKSEVTGVHPEAPLWQGMTAHAEHCLASKCPVQSQCFMYKIRQKAMAADCVVVNHHLFFADSRLKNEGFGALLPSFEVFIFDEAHQLPETALLFYSQSFSTAQILRLVHELDSATFLDKTLHRQIKQSILQIEESIESFLHQYQPSRETIEMSTAMSRALIPIEVWSDLLNDIASHLKDLTHLSDNRFQERLAQLLESMQRCSLVDQKGVAWLQALKNHAKCQWSPFDVSSEVKKLMKSLKAALIMTSATLRTSAHFNWFTESLGLEHAILESWESPYDWQKNALLYIPRGMPDVFDSAYHQHFIEKIWPIIQRIGGKTFILFTSHKALQWTANFLTEYSNEFPILVQGNQDKTALLNTFREHGRAVLLGTGSFWEGVDVQGEALSCVAIDKLPFANVSEPLMAGKIKYLKKQGREPFSEIHLPQAIIALKQGIGRLLRTENDSGVLIIGDPRLITRDYGAEIKKSLPPMFWTRCQQKVFQFIEYAIKSTPHHTKAFECDKESSYNDSDRLDPNLDR